MSAQPNTLGLLSDCVSGKRRFDTELAAAKFLRRPMSGLGPSARGRRPIRAYLCHLCDGWHVTSHKHRRSH